MNPYRVLLAFPAGKEDTAALIKQVLTTRFFSQEQPGEVLRVTDAAQAREALAGRQYHLLITDVQLPETRASVVGEGMEGGLALLQSLEEAGTSLPSLLVAGDPGARLYQAAQELTDCRVLPENDHFHLSLLKYTEKFLVKKLYRPGQPTAAGYALKEAVAPLPARKIANINITINLDQRYGDLVEGHYRIQGFNFNFKDEGLIRLDYETLLKLKEKSRELEDLETWPDWEKKLREVGADLSSQIYNQIHKGNKEFTQTFLKVLEKVGTIENTRIRFILKRETFPVIMEALMDDPLRAAPLTAAEQKFLMLQAPIYRRVDIPIDHAYPLFAHGGNNREPLNCLVIEAEAAGYVPKIDMELQELTSLRDETDWLLQHLNDLKLAGSQGEPSVNIGEIFRLEKTKVKAGQKFSDRLKELLGQQSPWHLVHFAGHSLYLHQIVGGELKGKGYFIFPGLNGEDNEAVEVSVLSSYLRPSGLRFLYLGSCYSAVTEFAIELANNLIPAILGFRWRVADAKACRHTQSFYRHLFELRSVDEAFLQTRREMHQEDPQDRTWAAPLLIMQVSD